MKLNAMHTQSRTNETYTVHTLTTSWQNPPAVELYDGPKLTLLLASHLSTLKAIPQQGISERYTRDR